MVLMKDEEIKLYNNVIERYHKIGIDSRTQIVVELEKEIIFYRDKIKKLEEQLNQTGEVFQATLESTIETEEGDTVIIIRNGQKIGSVDVYFAEGENA